MADRFGADEVRAALQEDCADRDVTTALLGKRADRQALGRFIAEEDLVVAGMPVVAEVFRQVGESLGAGATVHTVVSDGARAVPGTVIASVSGPARVLLAGERVALNFLQRLSGIATLTRRAVDSVAGTGATITDTRKTTPGLRRLEKYAVRCGGGENHRMSLADAVLWKDNHWALLPGGPGAGLAERLAGALQGAPPGVPVIVEVETEAQFRAALAAGVTRVLVDNRDPGQLAAWAREAGTQVAIEASGGITPADARPYALAGARFISIGALTHSAPAAAIRLDLSDDRGHSGCSCPALPPQGRGTG